MATVYPVNERLEKGILRFGREVRPPHFRGSRRQKTEEHRRNKIKSRSLGSRQPAVRSDLGLSRTNPKPTACSNPGPSSLANARTRGELDKSHVGGHGAGARTLVRPRSLRCARNDGMPRRKRTLVRLVIRDLRAFMWLFKGAGGRRRAATDWPEARSHSLRPEARSLARSHGAQLRP